MSEAPGAQRPSAVLRANEARRPIVVVVTGLSGAGRTTALRALEDLGFFCIDNLPTALAPHAVTLCEDGGILRIALGIDVRVRAFFGDIGPMLSTLEDGSRRDVHVLFVDASDETLLRRYSETRRPHALAQTGTLSGSASVLEGIAVERERLAPLRAQATRILDTTTLSVHELRRAVLASFGPTSGAVERMTVRIVSFGFKYGAPADADLVFDVRFLKNPYFEPGLKRIAGTHPRVRDFVMALPETAVFLDKTLSLLEFVVPKYEREGKSYLTVAIGCTGGMHRSVVVAEHIARELDARLQSRAPRPEAPVESCTRSEFSVSHRDIGRVSTAERAVPTESTLPPSTGTAAEQAGDLGAPRAIR